MSWEKRMMPGGSPLSPLATSPPFRGGFHSSGVLATSPTSQQLQQQHFPTSTSHGALSRRGSAASTSSMHGGVEKQEDPEFLKVIRSYTRFFCNRLVQVLVQARQNEKYDTKCDAAISTAWFNLNIEEIGEVSSQLKRFCDVYPPDIDFLSIDFILYTAEGDTLPLETWQFGFVRDRRPVNPFAPSLISQSLSEFRTKLYHHYSVLLRGVMVASRMTPMHRYYVKKQGAESYVILYHVQKGRSSIDLGEGARVKQLGLFETPTGAFELNLAYRTNMEIVRAATPASNVDSFQQVPLPGTSPEGQCILGSPNSFCDVLSHYSASPSSQLATSPDSYRRGGRSRTTSEALSEGSGVNIVERTLGGMTVEEKKECDSDEATAKGSTSTSSSSEDDDDEFALSKGEIAADMPFANLFQSSRTGVLLTNNLSEAQAAIILAASQYVDRQMEQSRLEAEKRAKEEAESEDHSGEPSTTRAVGQADDVEDEEGEMSTSSKTVTGRESGRGEEEEEGKEEPEGDVMNATLTAEDGDLIGDMFVKSLSPQSAEALRAEESKRRRESGEDEEEEEEEDSYVQIAAFGESDSQEAELQRALDLFRSCEIAGSDGIDAANVLTVVSAQLSDLARYQGRFDSFVAEVREAVEEEERREQEHMERRHRAMSGGSFGSN